MIRLRTGWRGAEILFWLTSRRIPRLGKGSGSVMVGSRRPDRVPAGRRLRLAWLRTSVRRGALAIGIGSAVRVVRHELLLLGSRSMAAMLPVQSWSGRAREPIRSQVSPGEPPSSAHLPGVRAGDEALQGVVAGPVADGQRHLFPREIVVGGGLDVTEYSDRCPMKHAGIGQPRQSERERGVRVMSIMHHQCVDAHVGHLHHSEGACLGIPYDAETPLDTEAD